MKKPVGPTENEAGQAMQKAEFQGVNVLETAEKNSSDSREERQIWRRRGECS